MDGCSCAFFQEKPLLWTSSHSQLTFSSMVLVTVSVVKCTPCTRGFLTCQADSPQCFPSRDEKSRCWWTKQLRHPHGTSWLASGTLVGMLMQKAICQKADTNAAAWCVDWLPHAKTGSAKTLEDTGGRWKTLGDYAGLTCGHWVCVSTVKYCRSKTNSLSKDDCRIWYSRRKCTSH